MRKINLRFMLAVCSRVSICTILLFAGLFQNVPLHAQVTPDWVRTFGSTGSDNANDVAIDAAGNRYIIGQFLNTVDFNPGAGDSLVTSAGAADIFIVKLDSDGNFVWVRSFGGTGTDVGTSIAVDASQNVYFTAYGGTINFGGGALTAT